MAFLNGYSALTTHGLGAGRLFAALCEGRAFPAENSAAGRPVAPVGRNLAFYCPERNSADPVHAQLATWLELVWDQALHGLSAGSRENFYADFALIFASTKGNIEDFIWTENRELDPFTGIVSEFLERRRLRPSRWLTVSNACASSHSAIALAREWIASGRERNVAVLAADWVGPFILQGFHALHALSPTTIRPFSGERDGLLLGEGAACAILGGEALAPDAPSVTGAAVDCEGYAVTRPKESGASLAHAVRSVFPGGGKPGFILAHGTGTIANDSAEDSAFHSLFGSEIPVTCTKWSVGHALGASGLIDLAAAAEALRARSLFCIGTTQSRDPAFRSRILTAGAPEKIETADDALITSLGFGGVHAAIRLSRNPEGK